MPRRKRQDQLRHWSTYETIGQWYDDYAGYVPIQMAQEISQVIKEYGVTFADAYGMLLRAGKIIHLGPKDDEVPE